MKLLLRRKGQSCHRTICFKNQDIYAKLCPIPWGTTQLKLSQATWFLRPLVKTMSYEPAAMDMVQKSVPKKNSGPSVLTVLLIECSPNHKPSSNNLTSRPSPTWDFKTRTHWHSCIPLRGYLMWRKGGPGVWWEQNNFVNSLRTKVYLFTFILLESGTVLDKKNAYWILLRQLVGAKHSLASFTRLSLDGKNSF